MRTSFLIVYIFLIAALSVSVFVALFSHKSIGKYVALLDAVLIPPVLGNFIITCSTSRIWSFAGRYIYFIGMDLVMVALLLFTEEYCRGSKVTGKIPAPLFLLIGIDIVQLALNPIFGHAFSAEKIIVEGMPYYRVIPYLGLTLHRFLDYGILAGVMIVFAVIVYRMPRAYREKYMVILISLMLAGAWQGFYVFLRIPVDRSMIGLALVGLMVFYFSLIYHPFRLIDRILTKAASEMSEALFVFDPTGKCIWINRLGCELVNEENTNFENVGDKLKDMFGDIFKDSPKESLLRTVGSGDDLKYYSIEINRMVDENNKFMGSNCRIYDYTKEHLMMKERMYAATHDALTGLYTKEHLFSCIKERLETDKDTVYVAAFVDVKNFKIVNDIFGKEFGDNALKCVADLIRRNACEKRIYGRIAGDTFGVFMPKAAFDAEKAERELSQFNVQYGDLHYNLIIHMGVYEVSDTSLEVSVMFDRANITLTRIKEDFKTHVAIYDDEIRNKVLWNQNISTQLDNAIKERQIRPYLQPIVDRNGRTVGAEALARWIHPEYGFMSPAAFIPVFEDNGMIVEVDKHMWRCACEILRDWKEKFPDMFISVNISPKDFYFIDVVAEIKALVKEYGIEPSALRIEITETVMMTDMEDKMKILEAFRDSGFIVEMDDFGSGYSSLNMLKDMPVDVLKIDMKFLERSQDDSKARLIVENIINLSENLGISSLTEGVETGDQYGMLSNMGCELFQGYYFAKPMPLEDFERTVSQ